MQLGIYESCSASKKPREKMKTPHRCAVAAVSATMIALGGAARAPACMALDASANSFAMTLASLSPLAARALRALFSLRRYRRGCLLLLGWTGGAQEVTLAEQTAAHYSDASAESGATD